MSPQISRLVIIFGIIIVVFSIVRFVAKPESFYRYGHYRGLALSEISSLPITYADPTLCGECHDVEAEDNRTGVHSSLYCQICHGPGEEHGLDPTDENIIHPHGVDVCRLCHMPNGARPEEFPQIDFIEHAEGEVCIDCHLAHNPGDFQ